MPPPRQPLSYAFVVKGMLAGCPRPVYHPKNPRLESRLTIFFLQKLIYSQPRRGLNIRKNVRKNGCAERNFDCTLDVSGTSCVVACLQ